MQKKIKIRFAILLMITRPSDTVSYLFFIGVFGLISAPWKASLIM